MAVFIYGYNGKTIILKHTVTVIELLLAFSYNCKWDTEKLEDILKSSVANLY